jgi:hypothetical protein
MKRSLLWLGGLVAALLVAGLFQSPAQAVHRTTVDAAGVMHSYSAPRLVGETHEQAVRRNLGQCPEAYFCAWHLYQWQGEFDAYAGVYMNGGFSLPGTGDNNTASSWFNNIACGGGCGVDSGKVYLYDDAHCLSYPWYRGMVRGQIASAEGSDWNDRVSSYNYSLNSYCPI